MKLPKTHRVTLDDIVIAERVHKTYNGKGYKTYSTFYVCLVSKVGRGGSLVELKHFADSEFNENNIKRVWIYPKKEYTVNKEDVSYNDNIVRFFMKFEDAEKVIKKK